MNRLTVASTGGARLHVEVHTPDGRRPDDLPTVVLAHGWTCRTSFWYPVLRELCASHRVVLYDQRGHGGTPATPGSYGTEELADDLCAVLEATVAPEQRAVVGGHSMGAMAIVAAAGRSSLRERAAAAMLCSTGLSELALQSRVFPLRSGGARRQAHRLFLSTALPLGPMTPLSKHLLRYVTMGQGATGRQRTQTARIVQAMPRKPRAEWGRVLNTVRLLDRLSELTVPTAVVHGTVDRLTPSIHAHRMLRELPRCVGFTELPGLGHMTPVEDPGSVAMVLRDLARDHLGGTREEERTA